MRIWAAALAIAPAFAQQPMRLTLGEAQRQAAQNHPRIAAVKYTAAAAATVPAQYRAAYEPVLYGSLTGVGADNGSRLAAGGLNNPVVYDRLGSGLTVGQMITDFGRTSNLVASAKLRAEAQNQAADSTRAQILLSVSNAYFGVLRARAIQKVAEKTVEARKLVSDQVTALADSKLKSTLDVSFANVNLAEAQLLLVQAQNDVKGAEADLASAMGLPGETEFDLAEEPSAGQLPDRMDELVSSALANRPELKESRLQESAAQRLRKAEHAAYFPSASVIGTAGFAPKASESVPGRYGAIGLNLNIPIFNGGLTGARTAEAEMKARAAGEYTRDLENRIVRDVRIAWLNATTAYDRVALTRQLLDQAQLALELAQSRYDLGLSSIVELNQAQLAETQAQFDAASARYDYQVQVATLGFATGARK